MNNKKEYKNINIENEKYKGIDSIINAAKIQNDYA